MGKPLSFALQSIILRWGVYRYLFFPKTPPFSTSSMSDNGPYEANFGIFNRYFSKNLAPHDAQSSTSACLSSGPMPRSIH